MDEKNAIQRVSGDLVGGDDAPDEVRGLARAHLKAVAADRSINDRVARAKAEIDAASAETMRRVVISKQMMDAIVAANPDDAQLKNILGQLVQQNADNLVKIDNAAAERRAMIALEDIRDHVEPEPVVKAQIYTPPPTPPHEARAANERLRLLQEEQERLRLLRLNPPRARPLDAGKPFRVGVPFVILVVTWSGIIAGEIPANLLTIALIVGCAIWAGQEVRTR